MWTFQKVSDELSSRVQGLGILPPMMENQMEKNMDNDMETAIYICIGLYKDHFEL